MTENRFLLTKDLGALTEEERGLHLENVCTVAGLDPRAGLLRYIMMDDNSGTGAKRLVLYATKGATNAIRENEGIDIVDLTYNVVGRAVVFTAKAKNKLGRTDFAVGAAEVQNKTGKALENAFALAQTRATRRVTLQMRGLDLLDESEVFSDGTSPLENAPLPLAEIGQPLETSSAIGTDITLPKITLPIAKTAPVEVVYQTTQQPPVTLPAHSGSKLEVVKEPVRIPNPAAGLKPSSTNIMASPDGVEPPPVPTATNQAAPAEVVKTKRQRRTKAQIEADKATAALVAAAQPAAVTASVETPVSAPVETPAAEAPKAKVSVGSGISKEDMEGYVTRLTAYRDVFIEAGMIPSDGLGPARKVREFVKIAAAGTELGDMTKEQWEAVFNFFDEVTKTHGTKALVATIEEHIKKIPAATV